MNRFVPACLIVFPALFLLTQMQALGRMSLQLSPSQADAARPGFMAACGAMFQQQDSSLYLSYEQLLRWSHKEHFLATRKHALEQSIPQWEANLRRISEFPIEYQERVRKGNEQAILNSKLIVCAGDYFMGLESNRPQASTSTSSQSENASSLSPPSRSVASTAPSRPPRARIVNRTTLDRDFDPDWKKYNNGVDAPAPYLHIALPGNPDMRLRLSKLYCSHPDGAKLDACKSGSFAAFWVSVEMDGKLRTYNCPTGPVDHCTYLWRTEGAKIIAEARRLSGAPEGVANLSTVDADGRKIMPKVPGEHASQCVALNKNAKLHGGFINKCDFRIYVSYCAYQPKQGAWNEIFNCEKNGGGLDDIAANGNRAAHTKGTYMYWFACKYPSMPQDLQFRSGQGLSGRCG